MTLILLDNQAVSLLTTRPERGDTAGTLELRTAFSSLRSCFSVAGMNKLDIKTCIRKQSFLSWMINNQKGYTITDQSAVHFVSFAVTGWVDACLPVGRYLQERNTKTSCWTVSASARRKKAWCYTAGVL